MKIHAMRAGLIFAVLPVAAFAQSGLSGISHPEPVVITATPDETVIVKQAKPSAAVAGPATQGEVYGAYVPYTGPKLMTRTNAATTVAPMADPDAGIVTSVPERAGELREGTLLKMRMKEMLSTTSTVVGAPFTAELSEAVEREGRVILPVGSVVDGRVTEVHSGKRISGAALLHLQPTSVTLPDGTRYILHAQLIDTSQGHNLRVDREGTLKRRDHAKETLAVVGGVTGAGAIAGGMIGGGVGAVVGAGIGAGASTVVWLRQDRQATLQENTTLVFSLTVPMILRPVGSVGAAAGLAGGSE